MPAASPPAVPQAVAAIAGIPAPSQKRQAPTWSAGVDEQTVSPVIRVKTVGPEPPQVAMPAAVLATTIEPTDFYEVAEEASDDRTALEISSGPHVVVAARVEQAFDQASSDQSVPAPKSAKHKNPKTTAKKPVSRDSANKEQHHAKPVAAPEMKDQAIASDQEPATGDMQEASSDGAFPDPISQLRELFGGQ